VDSWGKLARIRELRTKCHWTSCYSIAASQQTTSLVVETIFNLMRTEMTEDGMKKSLRSNCPIAASLDILGDRWSLLILRDILLGGTSQFGEFASEEGIATNILSDRLAMLVDHGIIERVPDDSDRRKHHYRALQPAVELLPVIAELVAWGVKHTDVPERPGFDAMLDADTRPAYVRERMSRLLAQMSSGETAGET